MSYSIETINKYAISCDGKIIGTELYDEILPVSFDGLESGSVFKIRQNGNWFIYAAREDYSTACLYKHITDFYNGVAVVTEEDIFPRTYCKLMNDKFEIISESFDNIRRLYNGLYLTVKNSKYGLLNIKGKEILPCEYNEVASSEHIKLFGREFVALSNDEKNVLIDQNGNVTVFEKTE